MPRSCTVCTHPARAAIDQALVDGEPLRNIAERYGTSATALFRHRSEHIAELLAHARAAEDVAEADGLLAGLRSLQARTLGILDMAETTGKLGVAVLAIGQARQNLELMAKLLHQIDERAQINILLAPEWMAVRSVLLAALAPFPDARIAVADRLAALEAGA